MATMPPPAGALRPEYPLYVGGRPRTPNLDLPVLDKYRGTVATWVPLADVSVLEDAISAAAAAAPAMRALASYERRDVLEHCVGRFTERAEELAFALCVEAGKPIRDARGEVTRLIDTFRLAAEEATRISGEVMPLDIAPRARGVSGMWKRVPVGPCAFISPFNFPLNLVAHKVAPALAAGCPFVLKPASTTPVGALLIGEVLAESGLPEGAFSIVPCRGGDAAPLVEDDRLRFLSFTGSPEVGWDLKRRAGRKRVVLELGGNAGCIVEADWDLDDAVARILFGGFYQSGQSCISVQRIFVHASHYDAFRDKLVAAVRGLKMGDPREEDTFLGPLISEGDAERLESWIAAAAARGARVLTGGARRGAMLEPAILEGVPPDEPICAEEAFGPVVVLFPYEEFEDALAAVNDSEYGLQAGVFTRDLYRAQRAWDVLEVGGVVIGDVPSFRVDNMPYGGVKRSGSGREGVRWGIEDMTELRLLVTRTPPWIDRER